MKSAKPITINEARVKIQTLCSRSEQCSHEVLTRLARWGVPAAQARELLDELVDTRYVDDARFAREFVHDKLAYNGWGRIKMRAALRLKRIEESAINEAISAIDKDEYREILYRVMANKAHVTPDMETRESRLKVVRHALSRGFEMSLVMAVERQMRDNR